MIAEIEGIKYRIDFKHTRGEKKSGTVCMIYTGEDFTHPVGSGSARCNSKYDNYCKETGRKLSLTRALESAPSTWTREKRSQVWKVYHGRKTDSIGK